MVKHETKKTRRSKRSLLGRSCEAPSALPNPLAHLGTFRTTVDIGKFSAAGVPVQFSADERWFQNRPLGGGSVDINQVSINLDYQISVHLSFQILEILSGFLEIWSSRFSAISIYTFLEIYMIRYLEIWIYRFQKVWVHLFRKLEFQISGYLSFPIC